MLTLINNVLQEDSHCFKTLHVWDSDDVTSDRDLIYTWNGYGERENQRSLLKQLEDNSDELRERFLTILSEIVSMICEQVQLTGRQGEIESLLVEMSLLAEANLFKSSVPLDVLRLLALESILPRYEIQTIQYFGSQCHIAYALRGLCEQKNLSFEWRITRRNRKRPLFLKLYFSLPHAVRSLIVLLRYTWKRWSFRKARKPLRFHSDNSIFLLSYFINLDQPSCDSGSFYSKYWEILPEVAKQAKKYLNWVHIFLFSPAMPNSKTGLHWVSNFNQKKDNQEFHAFLETFLTGRTIREVLYDWLQLQFAWIRLTRKVKCEVSRHSHSWLWPVFEDDWKNSIVGDVGIQNLIWIHLFDNALSSIPTQRIGLYLYENQGWERAFIRAWRKHNHGKLIGVVHSTVRYWSLNYFDSKHLYKKKLKPDLIAVNGSASLENLRCAGQTVSQYVPVEALRYLYISQLIESSSFHEQLAERGKKRKKCILILGDIQPETTHRMLVEIGRSLPGLQEDYEVWIKPHPANPVNLNNYSGLLSELKAEIVEKPIVKLIPDVSFAIASVFTSAALDVYCSGVPVISYLDPYGINYSNLRGIESAVFFASAEEFILAIQKVEFDNWNPNPSQNFFWFDSNLPRWKKLLEI